MEDLVQALTRLGYAESEARAYIVLLQRVPLTGYEVAKVSGVPRGNIDKVLEKLELRGSVLRIESPEGVQCGAVTPDEMLPRLAQTVQRKAARAQGLLERMERPPHAEQVWNV